MLIFWLAGINVARKIEVEIVFEVGDFIKGDHAGIARHIYLLFERVHHAVDVLLA